MHANSHGSPQAQQIDSEHHTKDPITIEHVDDEEEDSHATDDYEVEVRIDTPTSSHFGIAVSTNAPTSHTLVSEGIISQPYTEADTNESLLNLDGGRDEFLTSTPTASERVVETIPRVRPRTLRRTRRSFSLHELWRRHGARTNGVRQRGMTVAAPEHFIDDDEELGLAFAPTSSDEERLIVIHDVGTDDDDWMLTARRL